MKTLIRACAIAAVTLAAPAFAADPHEEAHPAAHEEAQATSHEGAHAASHEEGHETLNTENLFGMVTGTSVLPMGELEVVSDTSLSLGKRGGSFTAVGEQLGIGYGVTSYLSASVFALGSVHDVKNVEGLDNTNRTALPGGGGAEVRLRVLDRDTAPVGLTLSVSPSWGSVDWRSGQPADIFALESKIAIDANLSGDRLLGAVNLVHAFEHGKERGASSWTDGNELGIGTALTYRLAPHVFVGGEIQYLRAYEGGRFLGDAVFMGPSIHWQVTHHAFVSFSWSTQVAGGSVDNPASLNLTDFERNRLRLRVGIAF